MIACVTVVISQRQAKEFARMIYRDIRQFVEEHREEYEAFLLEEETRENGKLAEN